VPRIVADQQRNCVYNNNIHNGKQKSKHRNARKMLIQQVIILRDISVVKIRDPNIQQDIEKEGEIQHSKIKPILSRGYNVLDRTINTENPERFNQKVQE